MPVVKINYRANVNPPGTPTVFNNITTGATLATLLYSDGAVVEGASMSGVATSGSINLSPPVNNPPDARSGDAAWVDQNEVLQQQWQLVNNQTWYAAGTVGPFPAGDYIVEFFSQLNIAGRIAGFRANGGAEVTLALQNNVSNVARINVTLAEAGVITLEARTAVGSSGSAYVAAAQIITPDAAPAPPSLAGSDVIDIGTTTATARLYTTVSDGDVYVLPTANAAEDNAYIIANGDTQAADGSEFYDFPISGLTLDSDYYIQFLHVAPSGTTKLAVPFSTLAAFIQSLDTTIGVGAGFAYATLPDDYDRSSWALLPRTLLPGEQIVVPTAKASIDAAGDVQGNTEEEFDIYIIGQGRVSRVTMSSANLVTAIRPDAPVLDNRNGVNPGSVQSWAFVTSGYAIDEVIDIQTFGNSAVVSIDGGPHVSSASDIPPNTPVELNITASDEFNDPTVGGIQMTGGVTASAVITTRAALSPVITEPLTNQSGTVGASIALSFGVTGAASQQFYERINGVDTAVAGATGTTLTINNAQLADSGRQFFAIATHAEGGTVRTPETGYASLTVVAAATRLQLPAGLRDLDGSSLAGQTITVDVHAADTVNSRVGAFLYRTAVLIPLNGPASIDNNQNGAPGTVRAVCRPQTSVLGTSVPALFIATQAVP